MYLFVYFRKYHFGETDDFSAVARLLQVYESYVAAAAAEVVKLPTFRNLETEVSIELSMHARTTRAGPLSQT